MSYIRRPAITIVPTMGYRDFIDEYVYKSPITGKEYLTDAEEVHTYIIKFTSGNTVEEAKLVQNAQKNDRRSDFIALKNHYEGVGVHTVGIVKADKILQYLFYSGEKNLHMWWENSKYS